MLHATFHMTFEACEETQARLCVRSCTEDMQIHLKIISPLPLDQFVMGLAILSQQELALP